MEDKRKDGRDIVNGILEAVGEGKQTLVDVSRKIVGDKENVKFVVENREVQPEPLAPPPKAESPRRAHTFHDAQGFADYLAKYKTKDTVIMVDVGKETTCAVINEKAAIGFEVITLRPVVHPLFRAWQQWMDGPNYTKLRKFADFLSENRRTIIDPDAKTLIQMLSQVKVSRKTTLQRGFGKHAINGIICEMDIMGETKTQAVELPDTIKIKVPLYLATEPVELEIDLTIDANEEDVFVKTTSHDLLEKRVNAFAQMLDKVRAIPEVVVTLGSPGYEDWKYL